MKAINLFVMAFTMLVSVACFKDNVLSVTPNLVTIDSNEQKIYFTTDNSFKDVVFWLQTTGHSSITEQKGDDGIFIGTGDWFKLRADSKSKVIELYVEANESEDNRYMIFTVRRIPGVDEVVVIQHGRK